MLDNEFQNNPEILSQYGGHNLWVNSFALRKMKVDRNTPDPADGVICKDENGEPTGIFKDIQNNSFLNQWFIGRLTSYKENRDNYLNAVEKCAENGITSA